MVEFLRVRVMYATKFVAIAVAVGAAFGTEATAAIFSTGFESPDYTLGALNGQQGWTKPFVVNAPITDVASAGVGDPAVPEGSQYAKVIRSTGDARAAKQFSTPALNTDPFVVDVLLAYGGVSTGSLPLVYITNSESSFNGVIFGFQESGGQVNITYRNLNTFTTLGTAVEDTFYRFQVVIDPATASYDIEVKTLGGSLIGSAQDALSRAGVNSFSHIGLSVLTGAGTLYADQLDISPVPEPSGLFLIGCAASAWSIFLRRRG